MNKLLLIIDAQIDFIKGSLPVEGAEDAMNRLAYYMHVHSNDYAVKVFTTDWHPFKHCSFKENGGPWPLHCVQNTEGAALWFPLVREAALTKGDYFVLRKGTSHDTEEYSIFDNFKSAQKLKEIVSSYHINQIDICGLTGDCCLYSTLVDALKELKNIHIKVLLNYSPSLDGGKKLKEYIEKNKIDH